MIFTLKELHYTYTIKNTEPIICCPGALYRYLGQTVSYIKLIILHNTNISTENVQIYNVPGNGEGGVGIISNSSLTNNKMYDIDLAPDETRILEFKQPLVLSSHYDSIQAIATTANKVTVYIEGAIE